MLVHRRVQFRRLCIWTCIWTCSVLGALVSALSQHRSALKTYAFPESLQEWIDRHTSESVRGVQTLRCPEDDTFETFANSSTAQKLALIHVDEKNTVTLKTFENADDFSINYFTHFVRMLDQALLKTSHSVGPISFILTSTAFAEQINFANARKRKLALFSSCMTPKTAHSFGVFVPRPYSPRESFTRSDSSSWDLDFLKACQLKRKQVVFRGALSSYDRLRLMKSQRNLHKGLHRMVNFSLTSIPSGAPCIDMRERWCPGGPEKWLNESGVFFQEGARTSMSQQTSGYRYIMSVDGVGCADRLGTLLSSMSAVLKQDSEYEEFWYKDLKAGKHFIQIKNDFTNLEKEINLMQQRSCTDEMDLVKRAQDFMFNFVLHPDMKQLYIIQLLHKYRDLIGGVCTRPQHLMSVTDWSKSVKG